MVVRRGFAEDWLFLALVWPLSMVAWIVLRTMPAPARISGGDSGYTPDEPHPFRLGGVFWSLYATLGVLTLGIFYPFQYVVMLLLPRAVSAAGIRMRYGRFHGFSEATGWVYAPLSNAYGDVTYDVVEIAFDRKRVRISKWHGRRDDAYAFLVERLIVLQVPNAADDGDGASTGVGPNALAARVAASGGTPRNPSGRRRDSLGVYVLIAIFVTSALCLLPFWLRGAGQTATIVLNVLVASALAVQAAATAVVTLVERRALSWPMLLTQWASAIVTFLLAILSLSAAFPSYGS